MSNTIKRLFRKFTRGGGSGPGARGRQQVATQGKGGERDPLAASVGGGRTEPGESRRLRAAVGAFWAGSKVADSPKSSKVADWLKSEPLAHSGSPVHEADNMGAILWRFLMNFPTQWTQFDAPDTTAVESAAFHRLIRAGLVDVRLRVLARGLPSEPEIEATIFATGGYKNKVADEIRSVVPEFTGQVLAMAQLPAEYRLNESGMRVRREYRQIGGGPVEEAFLATQFTYTIPGVVAVTALRYIAKEHTKQELAGPKPPVSGNNPAVPTPTSLAPTTTVPTAAAPATATSTTATPTETVPATTASAIAASTETTPAAMASIATVPVVTVPTATIRAVAAPVAGKKSPRSAAWPVAKTEGHVAAYLAQMKNLYIKMARDVLDGMTGAIETFRKTFGSTVIAEAITRKVGIKTKRACNKKDVDKTHAYRSRVQPLLRIPPEAPDGWEEMRTNRHGEGIDELAAGIPFAKDNSPLDDADEWEMLPEEEDT